MQAGVERMERTPYKVEISLTWGDSCWNKGDYNGYGVANLVNSTLIHTSETSKSLLIYL